MQINVKQLMLAVCLSAAVAVTGLTGCRSDSRSAGTAADDKKIASRVKSALDDAPVYKYPHVDVSSFNGTVQLNGFVATEDQKRQAAQIASRVDGVKEVVNNITVTPMPTGRTNAAPIYTSPNPPVTTPQPTTITPGQPQQQ